VMAGDNPLSHIVQHPIKKVPADAGFLTPEGEMTVFSDHISMLLAGGLLLLLIMPRTFKKLRNKDSIEELTPRGFGNAVEVICQYIRKEVAEPNLGEYTDRFIKYIWSVFFFILTLNLLGLLPIPAITSTFLSSPLGGTATANIWVTSTLALTTFFLMFFYGFWIGGKDFISHWCPGPIWLAPILVPLEAIVGPVAKGFALAVRLFANMVAGHVLLAVLLGFILKAGTANFAGGLALSVPIVLGSVAITMLEIFVGFVQAFVFTYLTTVFIGMSVLFHHDDHHEEAHG